MSKYIIDIPDGVEWGVVTCRTEDGFYTRDFDSLEELNSDYINEHFGDLQDTAYQKGINDGSLDVKQRVEGAYQKGFEDGKKSIDLGCKDCKYHKDTSLTNPCSECTRAWKDHYTPAPHSDRIEVGDEVTHKSDSITWTAVVTQNDNGILTLMGRTGAIADDYDEKCLVKTGRHFNIASILEDMKT